MYGVIGDPITHSLSPAMHNAAFESLDMDALYVAFRVPRGEASAAVRGIRSLGISGVNVTMPHKMSIIRYLDRIDGDARKIGAVNTIVRSGARLLGYNTDGKAALETLSQLGTLNGRKAVILGAGGAARAIAYCLSKGVDELTVLNRTRSRGSALAAAVGKWSRSTCQSRDLSLGNLRRQMNGARLLINTLPADVFPHFGETIIREQLIGKDVLVLDANYKPGSDFIAKAEMAGAKASDGLEMLVRQAAYSFKLWTGQDPPIKVMRDAAAKARAK